MTVDQMIDYIIRLPPALRPFLFDCAVNHGPSQAIKFLQQACGIVDDGVCGPITIGTAAAVYSREGNQLIADLIDLRHDFYLDIVANDPSQRVFLEGWLNRLDEFGGSARA